MKSLSDVHHQLFTELIHVCDGFTSIRDNNNTLLNTVEHPFVLILNSKSKLRIFNWLLQNIVHNVHEYWTKNESEDYRDD